MTCLLILTGRASSMCQNDQEQNSWLIDTTAQSNDFNVTLKVNFSMKLNINTFCQGLKLNNITENELKILSHI